MGEINFYGGGVGIGGGGAAPGPDWAVMTPATLLANTNDWVPPATTTGWVITLGGGDRDLTGIVPPLGTSTAQNYWLVNFDITSGKKVKLKHDDPASLVTNRFCLPDGVDFDILPYQLTVLTYNQVFQRWFILAGGRH